jgi:hypothetical protein
MFCTFQTSTLIPSGTVVKKSGSSVVAHDNAAGAILVGVVIESYTNEDNQLMYAEVHMGGGYTEAKLSSNWDGTFSYLTINNDGVQPTTDSGNLHGYLMPEIIPVPKVTGDIVPIYWRGAT